MNTMPYLLTFLLYTFSIVQQPHDNTMLVSSKPNVFTYFARTLDGNIGLLAEMNKTMFELKAGDILTLTYPNKIEMYEVVAIQTYHTNTPCSPTGIYTSDQTGRSYGGRELAYIFYAGAPHRLVLQTCFDWYAGQGCASGRLLITAYPVNAVLHDTHHPMRCGSKTVFCQ
jgi:hypothetical protein